MHFFLSLCIQLQEEITLKGDIEPVQIGDHSEKDDPSTSSSIPDLHSDCDPKSDADSANTRELDSSLDGKPDLDSQSNSSSNPQTETPISEGQKQLEKRKAVAGPR